MRRPANWPIVLIGVCSLMGIVNWGCGQQGPKPETIIENGGYATALDRCIQQGKDAGSYAVYEDCAQRADAVWGRTGKGK
jgi:hypothetical protein